MPSTATLATLRTRIQNFLTDTGAAVWTTTVLDEAIRLALEEYSGVRPARVVGSITLASDAREIALSSLTGLVGIDWVWFPYVVADNERNPLPCPFRLLDNAGTLSMYLTCITDPAADDIARVFYKKLHTLNGLDSATGTTFDASDDGLIVVGASGYACLARSIDLNETAGQNTSATPNYGELAQRLLLDFRTQLGIAGDSKRLEMQRAIAGKSSKRRR